MSSGFTSGHEKWNDWWSLGKHKDWYLSEECFSMENRNNNLHWLFHTFLFSDDWIHTYPWFHPRNKGQKENRVAYWMIHTSYQQITVTSCFSCCHSEAYLSEAITPRKQAFARHIKKQTCKAVAYVATSFFSSCKPHLNFPFTWHVIKCALPCLVWWIQFPW